MVNRKHYVEADLKSQIPTIISLKKKNPKPKNPEEKSKSITQKKRGKKTNKYQMQKRGCSE